MRVREIYAHKRRRPFIPIRVFLSDGSSHDVRYAEFMFVTRRDVVVATPQRPEEIPKTGVDIDPLHITRIEPINGKKRRPKSRKSR